MSKAKRLHYDSPTVQCVRDTAPGHTSTLAGNKDD